MESPNHQRIIIQTRGFADGFDVVVKTLKLCLAADTHLNIHVRNIINQTFEITINELIKARRPMIEEYTNAITSEPPK